MLRKLDKNFCTSLKQACKENTTLNDTLKKYKALKQLIRTRRSQLIRGKVDQESDYFLDEVMDVTDNFIKTNLNMNECLLLLAIYAPKDKYIHHLANHELASIDLSLSVLMFHKMKGM